jgi:hypothetical protein
MSECQLNQSAPRRAWGDSREWLLNHIIAWFLAFFLPGGGTMLTTWLIPSNIDTRTAALYGFLAGLAGLLLLLIGTYIWNLFRAPYRQRNEVRKQVIVQAKHEDIISHFASIVREADTLAIINVRERDVTDEILREAINWTRKAINDVSNILGEIRNKQIRTIAELPLDGELKDEHFKVPYARSTFGHELGLIRDRHYKVYYWLKEFIETSLPTLDKEDS